MSDSPSNQRAKRQRVDKGGRFAALERLKGLKGSKNKYEVAEIENVYEEVSEKEYANRVLSRAEDDWIEEDGSGYVEDGREIFDEVEEDDEIEERSSKKRKADSSMPKEGKKRLRDVSKPAQGKGSIRNLFGNVSVNKKKEPQVKLEEDDILAGILDEIGPESSTNSNKTNEAGPSKVGNSCVGVPSTSSKLNAKTEMAMVKQYMVNLTKAVHKKSVAVKNEAENDDDEMLERILKPTTAQHKTAAQKPKTELMSAEKKKVKDVEEIVKSTAAITTTDDVEQETNAGASPVAEEYTDDMDFSILEDDENQFASDNLKAEQLKQEIAAKELQNYESILSNWESIGNNENGDVDEDDALLGSIDADAMTSADDSASNKKTLKFWFWDAWEDPIKLPGKVFLFGRVPAANNPNEFRSACVTIENVERNLYVLPRKFALDPETKWPTSKEVSLGDVWEEMNATIPHNFRSKKVTKHFAFTVPDVDVPQTSEYLNVRFDAKYPAPSTKKRYNTIAHIFGTNTNALETFLLDCKIKGPCWLNITNFKPMNAQSSWCSQAIMCSGTASISVAPDVKIPPPPPLVVMTLYVRTALHAKTHTNEICMISALVNTKFSIDKRPPNPPFTKHFCAFTRLSAQNWPIGINEKLTQYKATKATKLESERTLLSWFLTTFKGIDPDLIVTHDMGDCQLDIICDRLAAMKMPMWSRIGRLNLSSMPKNFKDYFVGRMICDVKSSAEELIKSRSYDLQTLCQTVLKTKEDERVEVSNDELHEMYESAEGILKLITLTMQDCLFVLRLMCELNVLPLALQITNICGNLMGRTLHGGRSERNEFLLLHAFDEKDYIVPDKKARETNWSMTNESMAMDPSGAFPQTQAQTQMQTQMQTQAQPQTGRKKPAYLGGLVLDPIKGFYEQFILLMDFNSLYPSIIQEYNICFTTVDAPAHDDDAVEVPDTNEEQGVLPRQLRNLVERRREVKKLMATVTDTDLRNQYDIRQTALKLTANSMYGCLGFTHSRFYAKHLAALVTQKGRDILLSTKGIVTKLNYEVIYGDTDSIMINTHSVDYDDVFKIGHNIKQAVNKIYRQVELDIDGVYKFMLLLNKKKYAAVKVAKSKTGDLIATQELKGLDIVRRDWSQISVTAGKMVLEQLFSDSPLDERIDNIHTYLEKIRDNINDDEVPLAMMTVTRQLTKAPKEYLKISSLPHVQVAIRMNATKNKRYKKGDMVNFVICLDGTESAATQRAYHLEELKTNEKLKIDKEYYLANQIYPVVSRLLKPIEATNSARIAQCLGLDPNKYKEAGPRTTSEGYHAASVGESIIQSNAAKYRAYNKFIFKCIACKADNIIAKPFHKIDNHYVPVLEACANKDCSTPPYKQLSSIRNQLTLFIRKNIRDYYDNWMYCDEPNCNQSTRTFVHVTDLNNRPVCVTCKQGHMLKSYTEGDLYKQLNYLQYMFTLPRAEQLQIRTTSEIEEAFNYLKEYVERILKRSAYQNIKMSEIFKQLHPGMLVTHIPRDLSGIDMPEN